MTFLKHPDKEIKESVLWGLSLLGRGKSHWKQTQHHFFPLKKQSTGFVFVTTHLGLQQKEDSADWRHEWRVWSRRHKGKDLGERLRNFGGWDIPGFHNSHLSWEELALPSQGKINYLTLWDTTPIPSGIPFTTPSEILFTPSRTFLLSLFSIQFCSVLGFCFVLFCFLSFLPSCI